MNEIVRMIIEFILKTLILGLIIWMIGLLFIAVFKINYNLTFLQSTVIYFTITSLKAIFEGKTSIKISEKE